LVYLNFIFHSWEVLAKFRPPLRPCLGSAPYSVRAASVHTAALAAFAQIMKIIDQVIYAVCSKNSNTQCCQPGQAY